ncbi:MAG: CBS domain-containing protein [Gemmataceae bacterium]
MVITTRQMLDLTAEDLMSRDIISIPAGMSFRAAVHRLAQTGVSGAPVIDEQGKCIGVLTRSDLVRFLDQGPQRRHTTDLNGGGFFADWQVLDFDNLPGDEVTAYMSSDVITARPETSIAELARRMHMGHVHRLFIVDPWDHVVGVVSAMDILGAVASEVEPSSTE